MTFLILGLALWIVPHWMKRLAPEMRAGPPDGDGDESGAQGHEDELLDEKCLGRDEAGADQPRVLRIEPYVAGIRYISGGKRVFAGAFAGKSRILLKLRIVDAAQIQRERKTASN